MHVMTQITIESITVADPPEAWRDAGFRVEGDVCRVGSIDVVLAGPDAGRGLTGWSLRGAATTEPADPHPNGVVRIDHVVAFSPDRARTTAALEAAGLSLRRLRDEPTPAGGGFQAFFRLGEAILEVVEQSQGDVGRPGSPARFWGIAFLADSLDAAAATLGDRLSEPRDAVQAGRQIATFRREAGLSFGAALMTPGPAAV
jgi:hypothetical protein